MGLHQNGFRDNIGVFRFAGAGLSNGAYPSTLPINTHLTGAGRNLTAGEGITDDKVGIPLGYLAGGSWLLPQKAGNMSSRYEANISTSASGLAVGGITSPGTSSITFTVADADGQLISSGSGTASLTFAFANALLTASVNGTGAASLSITPTALLGALASGEGSAGFTVSIANAQARPLNDASPLREGTASFAITGALTPYAIGSMSGSTVDDSALTSPAIAAAVWEFTNRSVNVIQMNGYTVTGTGQEGDPWRATGVSV